MAEEQVQSPLTYKGRPLTRCNNEIYYGSPKDPYVVFMQVLSTEQVAGEEIAGKIHLQLLSNDAPVNSRARVVKESDKSGLYSALDIAHIWLEKAASGKL